MSLSPTDLLGAWTLDDWYVESADGKRTAPFGRNASGAIMYTDDGYMTAIVSAAERFLPADRPDDAQKAGAFSSYFNYAGRWTIDGDSVTHRIELALDPNLVGIEMTRAVDHQGNRMIFTGTMSDGKTQNIIIWKRR